MGKARAILYVLQADLIIVAAVDEDQVEFPLLFEGRDGVAGVAFNEGKPVLIF